uniref:C-type lectin domain-containing protein n=1 Tax=Denticeps clupeoides TaxID=299321 RepID=A0AAY4C8X8_9TELE
ALLIISILVLVIIITVSLLCESISCDCPDCEPGWEYLSGKCYFFSTDTHTWDESQKLCVSMKAHLFHTVKMDLSFLHQLMWVLFFWIGLTDKEHEGTWLWADNTSLVKRYKYKSGLTFYRNYMGGSFTGWVDTACNRNFRRICEKDSCNITNDA